MKLLVKSTVTYLPKISLVTCSYQQAPFLEQTLRSVIGQEYSNLEYIVIDGGSTDGSIKIMEKYAHNFNYYISENDSGQSDALNKGLRRCSGEIIGWLCSDDLLLPDSLETIARYFSDNPGVDAVYGNSILIDADGKVIRAKREMGFSPFSILHDHNYIPQPSMFWRRSLMQKVGFLDESLHLSMDADYWLRFSTKGRVEHISNFISCMRMHDTQKVFINRPGVFKEARFLKTRYSKAPNINILNKIFGIYARMYRIGIRFFANGYRYSIPKNITYWLNAFHKK